MTFQGANPPMSQDLILFFLHPPFESYPLLNSEQIGGEKNCQNIEGLGWIKL